MTSKTRGIGDRRFVLLLAILAAVAAALPGLLIAANAPANSSYLGHVYNADDHMVYAAWMRQAMDGSLLFDNRFTTDTQPGLTIHLYFFVLGLIAKITGIAFASNLARVGFTFLFVLLLHRLVQKFGWGEFETRLATILPLVAGGIGFLVWHNFGVAIVKPSPLGPLMLGKLPVDVWQPEVFVFPSMLSNGLFMVSLCLIATIFLAVLHARENKKAVLWGAGAMFLLMNIHSYDVLLVTFALVGFLATVVVRKQLDRTWLIRACLIGLGAIPPALWFVYVLKNDPVFQARAATETFSPNFRAVFFGLLGPILLALAGFALRKTDDRKEQRRWLLGLGLLVLLIAGLFVSAAGHTADGYFMSMPVWAVWFVIAVAAVALLAEDRPAVNLMISWAVIGLVAIYFPALFQRKLAMGLVIPWSILATVGIVTALAKQEARVRLMVAGMAVLLLGASSLRWIGREMQLSSANVSNTTVHPVYLGPDIQKILDYLNAQAGKKVVIAMPGVPAPVTTEGDPEPNFATPVIPDLNPIASGLAGVYTYAGHWSETPNYNAKRNTVTKIFVGQLSDPERAALLKETGANYVITPNPTAFPSAPLYDFSKVGEIVVDGPRFRLVKLP